MFTPDGQVREEFAKQVEAVLPETAATPATPPTPADSAAVPIEPPERVPASAPELAAPVEPAIAEGAPGARLELPDSPAGLGPGFLDLVELLAQPVPFYLGDVALPDGQSVENLEMARLHIDMLAVLRQRTVGNLTADELTMLEDLLYRLRMRYVQKRG